MALTQTTLGARLRIARENCGMTQEEAAEAIGLARTSLLQIEAGNRAVSTLELVKLSRLFHQDITRLLSDDDEEEDTPTITLYRILPEFADRPEVRKEISYYLDLFEEGVRLAQLLGRRPGILLPSYVFSEPSSFSEAARQGELVAIEERRRLNLGTRPIADVALLLVNEGIWAAAARLPDEISGLFLHNRRIGVSILVNQSHRRGRQRFSYCHEYAHALIDRTRHPATVSGSHNSGKFAEKRANAFAGAFLMPAEGVCELLEQLNKGGSSRETHWLWDVATGEGEYFEKRNPPGSQQIGYQDVAYLAHEFMVSYETAVYRLTDMRLLDRQEQSDLLELRKEGQELLKVLKLQDPEDLESTEHPLLVRQIGRLAIEAFRREAISGGRLLDICEKLGIPDGQRLLQLARAA